MIPWPANAEKPAATHEVPTFALRPAQAAKSLGVSERLVSQLIASGELASFTIGRARLIAVDAIRDFIARKGGGGTNGNRQS